MWTGYLLGNDRGGAGVFLTGWSLTAADFLGNFTVMTHYRNLEEDARDRAFATYNASLRRQLNLCVQALQVVDCDSQIHAAEPNN